MTDAKIRLVLDLDHIMYQQITGVNKEVKAFLHSTLAELYPGCTLQTLSELSGEPTSYANQAFVGIVHEGWAKFFRWCEDMKISVCIFSASSLERPTQFSQWIKKHYKYKVDVFGLDHTIETTEEKKQKSLKKLGFSLDNTLLVDDTLEFIPDEEQPQLWINHDKELTFPLSDSKRKAILHKDLEKVPYYLTGLLMVCLQEMKEDKSDSSGVTFRSVVKKYLCDLKQIQACLTDVNQRKDPDSVTPSRMNETNPHFKRFYTLGQKTLVRYETFWSSFLKFVS